MEKTIKKGHEVMTLAWQFVKRNGYSINEALKIAWINVKLMEKMQQGIVKFYFRRVDGTPREAFGTLSENIAPEIKPVHRKINDTVQPYYDTERQEWRCFKKANLLTLQ